MLRKKGFTLVELMVVILIVGILAAVVIPIMRGRIDSAKWSEGKAMAGTIASSIRAYATEFDQNITNATKVELPWVELGLQPTDFKGKYFSDAEFDWAITYTPTANALTFLITIDRPALISSASEETWTLDHEGTWTGTIGQ